MDTNNNNNNEALEVVFYDATSYKTQVNLAKYDNGTFKAKVGDFEYSPEYVNNLAHLSEYVKSVYREYSVIEADNWFAETGMKVGARPYHERHIIVCYSISNLCSSRVNTKERPDYRNLVDELLQKGKYKLNKARRCNLRQQKQNCSFFYRGHCGGNGVYCPNYCSNGYNTEIIIYEFSTREEHVISYYNDDVDQSVIDNWHVLLQKKRDQSAQESARIERNARIDKLLRTKTFWLSFPTLKVLYDHCGDFGYFMEVINNTITAIQEFGVWDVEVGTSKTHRENSCMFETTKSNNGSTALAPRHIVYVENPKLKQVDVELAADRIELFLTLTFYRYAGIKPMLPVVQVSKGNGCVDYVVDYSADEYFVDDSYCEPSDTDYEGHDEEELDEYENYAGREDEFENESYDTSIDFTEYDEEDASYATNDFLGTDSTVSLLVTDPRKAKPFKFELNWLFDNNK